MKISIKTRLVVLFAVAALATFALTGVALYGVLERQLDQILQGALKTTVQEVEYSLSRAGDPQRWGRFSAKLDTLTPTDGAMRFWVFSDDPHYEYGKGLADISSLERHPDGFGSISLPDREHALRTMTVTVNAYQERPQVRLIVGIDTAPYVQTMRTFLWAMAGLSLTAVLLVIGLGYWVARVGLRPLSRLSQESKALRPSAFSQRLTMKSLPVELEDLAASFNGALSRLEGAYNQLEAFNADVAHELRTPLTNLIGQTQVALSRQRSVRDLEEVLQSNLEELDRLRSMINDMLFLARADQGESATGRVHAVLAQEIDKTIEFFEFLLDEAKMTVQVEGDLQAQALIDTSLFRRAVTNVLQNSIQHSSAGAQIVVRILLHADQYEIAITNPGAPIATEHLSRLFQRFYRVDAARRGDGVEAGHGLGLAIVKAVATMHGGTVSATSDAGLTTIRFSVEK